MDGVYTVGEVVRYLREMIDEDLLLSRLWVSGEISNLSSSSAGHTYFTLKDQECQLRCVLFRHAARGQAAMLTNGAHILACGRIAIYETQGSIQLYVDIVQPEGVGILHRRFEELRARLQDEGLFEESRKRPLPEYPRRIGVVTSAQAAAFADICRVLAGRFPAAEVVLAHSAVQGEEAPAGLVAAIEHLGGLGDIDVIIVARGGGSMEDLWAFNEEMVARAIVASPVPIVTGIGHETDITVADLAADRRAPTPSAAAMAVVPDRDTLLAQIAALRADLGRTMRGRLVRYRRELAGTYGDLRRASPALRLAQRRQTLDELQTVLRERVLYHIAIKGERLRSRHIQLKLLDPLRTLDRGFALVTGPDGASVRRAAVLSAGDRISVRFRDGQVGAVVQGPPAEGTGR